jgi:hypothetical protein
MSENKPLDVPTAASPAHAKDGTKLLKENAYKY